jgi:hypothetical protein
MFLSVMRHDWLDRTSEGKLDRAAHLPATFRIPEARAHRIGGDGFSSNTITRAARDVGHEFLPGQSKEIDMTTEAIQVHAHRLRTDRGFYQSGPNVGKPFPAHPVKIVGLGPKEILKP